MVTRTYDHPTEPALMRREPLEAFWNSEAMRPDRPTRPTYVCPECGLVLEAELKRCPVCRRKRKLQRRRQLRAADNYRSRISKAKRERIYERDGYRCLACGQASRQALSLDHIVPISKGGTNSDENLQTLCKHCNCKVKRGKETSYLAGLQAA